jgi:hypothetical protein
MRFLGMEKGIVLLIILKPSAKYLTLFIQSLFLQKHHLNQYFMSKLLIAQKV